jgi:hypothetical protein
LSTIEISPRLLPPIPVNLDELLWEEEEDGGDDLVHIVPEGEDIALCGAKMTGAEWLPEDTGVDCVDCAYLFDPDDE